MKLKMSLGAFFAQVMFIMEEGMVLECGTSEDGHKYFTLIVPRSGKILLTYDEELGEAEYPDM